ncbi:hypothetical protein G6F56_008058 [Rhizopus delemar]|nr:hypothetical protein G6F56_008058 [Rhizopus delemar]
MHKNNKLIEKPKRKQVKNACATCRNSDRKERKKGVKRGPYKKRQIKENVVVYPQLAQEPWMVPTQMQWTDLIGCPANSFADETLHWEAEKIWSMPLEQHYELDLFQEPHVWYPVSPCIPLYPTF